MSHNGPEQFKRKYEVNPENKCWEWQPAAFRFRVDGVIHNPRRYAAQANGYAIPNGRYVICGCGNERCVHPHHTRLKHNGAGLDPNYKLHLSLDDFAYPPGWLARQYCVDKHEIKRARQRTLDLIYAVKRTSISAARLANKYDVSEAFIKQLRDVTKDEFKALEHDPNAGMYDIEDDYNPAGEDFKPSHHK